MADLLAESMTSTRPCSYRTSIGVEQFRERCHHGLGRALVEAGTDHQPRLRRNDDNLEGVGRDALLVAQARGVQGCIHAGEAGTDDQDVLHGWIPPIGLVDARRRAHPFKDLLQSLRDLYGEGDAPLGMVNVTVLD